MCMPRRWDHSAWFKLILLLKEIFFLTKSLSGSCFTHYYCWKCSLFIVISPSDYLVPHSEMPVLMWFFFGRLYYRMQKIFIPTGIFKIKHFQQRIYPDKHFLSSSSFSVVSKIKSENCLKNSIKPHPWLLLAHQITRTIWIVLSPVYNHKKCVISMILRLPYQCHFEVGSSWRLELLFSVSVWLSL